MHVPPPFSESPAACTGAQSRIEEAGASLVGIASSSVRVLAGSELGAPCTGLPAFVLCRGLLALGVGRVELDAPGELFWEIERLLPGLAATAGARAGGGSADPERHDLCVRIGRGWICSEDRVDLALDWDEEGLVLRAGSGSDAFDDALDVRASPALSPLARVAAGLALQEILIRVAGVADATEPAASVRLDARLPLEAALVEPARVDLVGAGGVGVHALEALAHCLAPGSELRVFDFDRVGPENLPVQPAYGPDDVGELKAMVISERIAALAPSIDVLPFPVRYEDRPDRLPAPGLRVACPDTFTARRYLNDCSVADGVPLVEAGTSPLVAQQRSYLPGRTACLGHQIPDLEARAAREVDVASCAAEHALTLPGTNAVAGGLLALAALRALDPLRLGAPVAGTTVYDARFAARFGELDRRPLCEHG